MSTRKDRKDKLPVVDPGQCRCCGNMKKCRLLNVEYVFKGKKEVYADMFAACFGLSLSNLDGDVGDRLICASCVVRLRDACALRAQAQQSELRLIDSKKKVSEKMMQNASKRVISALKNKNALENAITVVENSYVCPFTTVYSDYHCVYCGEMFSDPNKLREHNVTHDPKTYRAVADIKRLRLIDVQRIDCRLCETRIDDMDALKSHLTTAHGKSFAADEDVNCEFLKFKLKFKSLSCLECDKTFHYFQLLKKHMADHFGKYICDECGAGYFQESLLTAHKNTHNVAYKDNLKIPCEECGKLFISNYCKNVHVARVHKNEPCHRCNLCNELFITYDARSRHKMEVHGEKRTLPCEICDEIFDTRKALREHGKTRHNMLPHECIYCGKKFRNRSDMVEHVTTHTGEKNFTCDVCGMKFARAKGLRIHVGAHHIGKRHQCSLCPRSYAQAMNLRNHMKMKHPASEHPHYGAFNLVGH